MGTHTPCRPTGPTKWLHIQHSTQDNCTLWCTWSQINTWSNICWLGLGFWEQNMTTDYSMSIPQTYGTTHCPHTSLHTGHTPARPLATYQPTHWTHTSPPTGHTPAHPLAIHQSTYWPYTSPPTSPPTGHTCPPTGHTPVHPLATHTLHIMMNSTYPHTDHTFLTYIMMDPSHPMHWLHNPYLWWWIQTDPSTGHTTLTYLWWIQTDPSTGHTPLT